MAKALTLARQVKLYAAVEEAVADPYSCGAEDGIGEVEPAEHKWGDEWQVAPRQRDGKRLPPTENQRNSGASKAKVAYVVTTAKTFPAGSLRLHQ